LESFRTANVESGVNSRRSFTIARLIARLNVGGPATQAILMTEAFQKRGYRALLLTGEVSPGEGSMDTVTYLRVTFRGA
jgi:hypothetical protein